MENIKYSKNKPDILKRIANNILHKIVVKYDFKIINDPISNSNFSISLKKGNVIIYYWLNMQADYELYLQSVKSDRKYYFETALGIIFPKITDIDNYLMNSRIELNKIIEFSEPWYDFLMNSEIHFIEQHFPTVFTEGDLSMFEK
jgi:hypothetical protein